METAREGRRLIISQEALETEGKLMDEGDFNHDNFANPGENMWDQQEQSEFNGNHEVNDEDINSRKNRMHAKVDSENVSDRIKRNYKSWLI